MLRLTLNDEERLWLAQTMKTTPERRRRERCQAILMAERGRPHIRIAEDLGVSVRTIQRWLNTYQAKGRHLEDPRGQKCAYGRSRPVKMPANNDSKW